MYNSNLRKRTNCWTHVHRLDAICNLSLILLTRLTFFSIDTLNKDNFFFTWYSQLFFPHPRTLSSFVLILSANLIQWSIIPFCWYAPATNANFFFLCTLIYYNSSIRITTKYFHKGRNKIEPLLHAKISGENHLISYYIYKLSISNSSLPGLFLSQKLVKRLATL